MNLSKNVDVGMIKELPNGVLVGIARKDQVKEIKIKGTLSQVLEMFKKMKDEGEN